MASIPWPAVNAQLLEATAPGAPDAYGDVAAAGAALWAGSIEAVLKRERRTRESQGILTTIELDVLVVRKPPAELADLTPGDQQSASTVLVEDRRAPAPYPQLRWHVVDVDNRARGKESDSLRLVLRDPRQEA